MDFKYNEELTQTYMSSNQIGGFFNRLEASRKYLFGSVGVLGTANNSIITGALIARGPEIKPVVEVAPDWESYTYERIDLENAEQKAFFEAALAWDLEVGDKKWVDGKNVRRPSFGPFPKLSLLTSVIVQVNVLAFVPSGRRCHLHLVFPNSSLCTCSFSVLHFLSL